VTGGESSMLGMTEPHRKHKDTQKAGHCMATTDHKVSIDCPWSIYSTVIALTFSVPFRTTHSLLSAGTRKYIQVCVQNLSELDFELSDGNLVDPGSSAELQLVPLNAKSPQVTLLQNRAEGPQQKAEWERECDAGVARRF